MQVLTETTRKKASYFKVLKSVGWAYLGVRSQNGREDDFSSITLGQTVITGILVWLVFVASLASVAIYVSS